MQFDDRLATVLRHRARSESTSRTQYRQLLDLLGSQQDSRNQKLLAAAWLRLGALSGTIPASERAHMISERGLRFRNPELAVHLADDEPIVASAALAKVQLSEDEWTVLIPRLPIRARGFLRLRRDLPERAIAMLDRLGIHDRGLPQPTNAAEADIQATTLHEQNSPPKQNIRTSAQSHDTDLIETDFEVGPEETPLEIGALVERIEAFQQTRNERNPDNTGHHADAPILPLKELQDTSPQTPITDFSFTTDVEGRIDWADLRVASMVVGQRLNTGKMRRAILMRQEINSANITLHGAEAISGQWIVDAMPRFTTLDASFFGYAGKFRRYALSEGRGRTDGPRGQPSAEADSLRQLLHELRTPINAIQGFAEVIQQQVFGPTPHEYRAIAANIVGDSAWMMAGFDEIDRLAKLEAGALKPEAGQSSLDEIAHRLIERLQSALTPRKSGFDTAIERPVNITLTRKETEALVWRIIATLASGLEPDEHISLEIESEKETACLVCDLPARFIAMKDIFSATDAGNSALLAPGTFGPGFALRLARAEAKAVGGSLSRINDRLILTLPALTDPSRDHSESAIVAQD